MCAAHAEHSKKQAIYREHADCGGCKNKCVLTVLLAYESIIVSKFVVV